MAVNRYPFGPFDFNPDFPFDEGVKIGVEQIAHHLEKELSILQDSATDAFDRLTDVIPALHAIADTATSFLKVIMACPGGRERIGSWIKEESRRLGINHEPS